MAWEDIEWGKVLVGVVSAAGTMYAAREQKKAQEKQYEYEQRMLEEQRQYQQDKYAASQNTPIAKMAPILMQSVLQLYGNKLKKFGVDLPMDQLMAALGMGSGSTLQSAMAGGGGGDTVTPEMRAKINEIKEARKAGDGTFGATGAATSRSLKNRSETQWDGMGGVVDFGGSIGNYDMFDQMRNASHQYMSGLKNEDGSQKYFTDSLISDQQMADFNIAAREWAQRHPYLDKAGQYLFSAALGAAVPGPSVPGMGKGVYRQLTKGADENITQVYGQPDLWMNGRPQYEWGDSGTYQSTPSFVDFGIGG